MSLTNPEAAADPHFHPASLPEVAPPLLALGPTDVDGHPIPVLPVADRERVAAAALEQSRRPVGAVEQVKRPGRLRSFLVGRPAEHQGPLRLQSHHLGTEARASVQNDPISDVELLQPLSELEHIADLAADEILQA